MSGKLIVFEGTDGSGKATQSGLLCSRLEAEGIPFRKIDFPRYGKPSAAMVQEYLNGNLGKKPGDVNAYAASVFFSVDRYASYKQDWGDFYEAGGLFIRLPSCRRASGKNIWTGCLNWNTASWAFQSLTW